jgi:hypothetical protein
MPFLDKIFSSTDSEEIRILKNGNIGTKKNGVPMRRLSVLVEDGEGKQISEETENENSKDKKRKGKIFEKEKEAASSISELKKFAEQIRHRVHYIDKNDFAKKAVSIKDKVYDSDLRRDLAYFLANGEFPDEEKNGNYFKDFEALIMAAVGNEKINYVVYGEKTYVVAREMDIKKVMPRGKAEKLFLTQKKAERVEKKFAEFSMEMLEVFRRNATVFAKDLSGEAQLASMGMITEEEKKTLIRIFTKRFLREMILEKKDVLKQRMSFDLERSEDFIEFICESIFK